MPSNGYQLYFGCPHHQSYFFQVCFPTKKLLCAQLYFGCPHHQSYFFQVLCKSSVTSCLHTLLLTNNAKDVLLICFTGYSGYQGFGLGS